MKIKKNLILFGTITIGIVSIAFLSSTNFKSKVYKVVLTKDGFNPSQVTIQKGDVVTFTTELNEVFWPASDPHPLHSIFPIFDPKKPISPGDSWKFKFSKIGSWNYHDHLFPSYRGKITVLSKSDFDIRNRVLTRDEVVDLVKKSGPEKSYSNLKRIYAQSQGLSVHTTFHLFGEVLYDKYGLDGITYCDDFAGFGCYHGIFIKAVGDKGLGVATELDQKCIEKFGPQGLGCPHGIGHGLVEYFGLGKIEDALSICARLTWQGTFFGCAGGVFMENNFPTVFDKQGVGKVTTRVQHDDLFEPCQSVPEKFRQSCYFEQASWWNQIFTNEYNKVGKMCNQLKIPDEKDACFLGLGNSFVEMSMYRLDDIKIACSQMPDKNTESVCMAGASWAFFANPDYRDRSEDLCFGLGLFEKKCIDKRMLIK